MTEEEWLSDDMGLGPFLRELFGTGTGMPPSFKNNVRRELLFAVACSRSEFVQDEHLHKAISIVERLADGLAAEDEVQQAREAAGGMPAGSQKELALAVLGLGNSSHLGTVTHYAERLEMAHLPVDPLGNINFPALQKIWRTQIALFRDIFGNPFRSVTINPAVLAWNNAVIVRLARAVYDERQLPSGEFDLHRLAVLADALEEAGGPAELAAHLRSPGPHVRGCFAVDLCLGLS